MQSLALDTRHPIALEIAGTGTSKHFLLRAMTPQSLAHAQAQLRARYPQAGIVPVDPQDDPLRLDPDEDVSVIELAAGRAAYLPLRTWQEDDRQEYGSDPLPGLLAALDALPEGTRAVAQIAIVPASPAWSQASLRKAVEHPLEPERARERLHMMQARSQEGTPSTFSLVGMGILLLGIVVFQRTRQSLPSWLLGAALAVVEGRNPQLSPAHLWLVLLWGGGLLLGLLALLALFAVLRFTFQRRAIYDQKLVTHKTMRMAYRARIRLYAIAPRVIPQQATAPQGIRALRARGSAAGQRHEPLLPLVAAYRQFHLASGNYFVVRRLPPWSARWLLVRPHGMLRPWQGWWRGVRSSSHYISHYIGVDTLAQLWHLLHGSALDTALYVEQRRMRSFPLPPAFLDLASGQSIIGYAEHAGTRLPFALPHTCLETHTLIGGKSGEGKSTCIQHLALELMKEGSGLLLIDPHGDLCDQVLTLVPPSRIDDVVLIDLADPTHSVGINPLDTTLGRGRDKAVADMLHTLSHIWMKSWGPRMENAFEMALRTLYEANKVVVARDAQQGPQQQYTLLDVLPLFTDESFLHGLLEQVQDPFLARWWLNYYEPLSLTQQRDIINPVISKTTKFESEIARRIVGQGCSTLNFAQLVQEQKIILVKLAKGEVGSDVAPLLGATLLGLVQMTLSEQGRLAAQARIHLPIIIDEFQTLEGTDYQALAELRKYGATFFLATQSFEYLKVFNPTLLATVLANVKNFLIYQMSAEDAAVIHRELGVEQEDITTLESHMCYVQLTYQGQRQPVFSLHFVLPPQGDPWQANLIRMQSQQRYARPVAEVEEHLREALIRTTITHSLAEDQKQDAQPESLSSGAGEATAASAPSSVSPKKKRGGAWVKGGKKNQRKQVTPSAFADPSSPTSPSAENEQEVNTSDESEGDDERTV